MKYDTNKDFPFKDLCLANPTGLQGGAYFSKLKIEEHKVLIQMPKCETKNGIHRTGKKIYTDLMFDIKNETFAQWIQDLSTRVKSLIYDKKDLWFQNEMTYDDIEYHWQNILRTYKKNNVLLRCIIKKPKNISRKELVMVYDEDENIISLDDIKSGTPIIPLLEITGLKFTTQSFLLEFALKQVMVLNEITESKQCLISIKKLEGETIPTVTNNEQCNNITKPTEVVDIAKENNSLEENEANDIKDLNSRPHTMLNTPIKNEQQTSLGNYDVENKKISGADIENISLEVTPLQDPPILDISTQEHLEKKTETTMIKENLFNNSNTLEKQNINEVNLKFPDEDDDKIALKKPDEVYMAIYKEAKRKAKEAKRAAIQAYLEAKRIKNKYMLDEIESSDDEFELDTYA